MRPLPLLAQLEAELAMGCPEPWVPRFMPEPYHRVCRNGHEITNRWEDHPRDGCMACHRLATHRALRRANSRERQAA